MRKKTGNWAEDTANGLLFFLKLGLYGVPFLMIIIVVLVVLLVMK